VYKTKYFEMTIQTISSSTSLTLTAC